MGLDLASFGLDAADAVPLDAGPVELGDWVVGGDLLQRVLTPALVGVYRDGAGWAVDHAPELWKKAVYQRIPAAHWRPTPKLFAKRLPNLLGPAVPALTSGCDPEVFAVDASGQLVPAWEFLPAKNAGSIYWDGAQGEFRVNEQTCLDYLARDIGCQLFQLKKRLPKGAKLSTACTLPLSPAQLASAKDEHLEFGCQPSLNAYGLHGSVVENPRALPFRFAGGHIHFGLAKSERNPLLIAEGIKMIDAILGVASVLFCPEDPIRRQYYGLAGEYRLPAHGVEYRSLSNFWLRSPQLYHWTFSTARKAFQLGYQGFRRNWLASDSEVIECVNHSNVALARELVERNRQHYKALWDFLFNGRGLTTLNHLDKGAANLFDDDISGNWQLGGEKPPDWLLARYTARWGTFCE